MVTSSREQTCSERIREYYDSRMETIALNLRGEAAIDIDDLTDTELNDLVNMAGSDRGDIDLLERVNENAQLNLDDMPLSIENIRFLKITMGWGGPGDWFEANIDADGSIGRIVYHFNDWGDHAEINVSDDETARAFCERFTESEEG